MFSALKRLLGHSKINGSKKPGRQHRRPLRLESLENRTLLALIGVVPQFPLIPYNSTGVVNYNAATQVFDLTATPLFYKQDAAAPLAAVTAPRSFHIQIQVNSSGQLVGGVAPPDLTITGSIDVDGDTVPDFTGTLLTGDILQFGFLEAGATDRYDFRFQPTGGELLSQFVGKDIAVTTTSARSTFAGSFATNFTGGASGNVGSMPSKGVVLGADNGIASQPAVTILDQATGIQLQKFQAYETNYRGGVRVAMGDVNGDGVNEVITAPGRLHDPVIKVFRQDGTLLYSFRAYAANFGGGVNIAVGDVNGDGRPDIVAAPTYGVSAIRVFQNLTNPANPDAVAFSLYKKPFQALASNFIGGATVQVADMNLDGKGDVLVGNGPGMRSTINVFNVAVWNTAAQTAPPVLRTFLPFDATFRGGVNFDAMKVNGADNVPDLIVGTGNAGRSRVQVLDGLMGNVLTNFFAYTDQSKLAPVRIGGLDLNGDGIADRIVTAQGTDGKTQLIRWFTTSGALSPTSVLYPDPDFAAMFNLGTPRV